MQKLHPQHCFSPDVVQSGAWTILEALEGMHALGVAHGNVTPKNLLLTQGVPGFKLCGFYGCRFQGMMPTCPPCERVLRPWIHEPKFSRSLHHCRRRI